jgi:hypothetical protein
MTIETLNQQATTQRGKAFSAIPASEHLRNLVVSCLLFFHRIIPRFDSDFFTAKCTVVREPIASIRFT